MKDAQWWVTQILLASMELDTDRRKAAATIGGLIDEMKECLKAKETPARREALMTLEYALSNLEAGDPHSAKTKIRSRIIASVYQDGM